MTPIFSFVLCTVGRVTDTLRFLDSLAAQTVPSARYEVILVDQSGDDVLIKAVQLRAHSFALKHIRSPRGLSLGRNLGLKHATGAIIAFPDDDCAYPPQTLATVAGILADASLQGVTGKSEDFDGSPSGPRAHPIPTDVTFSNIWRCAVSYTIFLRAEAISRIGTFDETLGVGSPTPYQSGEETDYLFRALRLGMRIHYTPKLIVNHPTINVPSQRDLILKDFRYALGMGRVVRKNRLGVVYFAPHLIKPVVASVLSLATLKRDRALQYWKRAHGRWSGFTAPMASV